MKWRRDCRYFNRSIREYEEDNDRGDGFIRNRAANLEVRKPSTGTVIETKRKDV